MSRFHVSKEVTMLADPSNQRTGLAPACFDTKIFDFGWWPSVRHPNPSRMRQRMQSQAFVTDTSPSREYQVDFWRSRATYFAEAADQSFVQWKAEKKLNDGKVRHLEDELAGIKKSMESYDITIIALHEKDQKNQGYIESLQNQLKEASPRHGSTAHGLAPLTPPAAPEALYPSKHSGDTPSQSQYSTDDSQRVSPISSPISTSPSSVSSLFTFPARKRVNRNSGKSTQEPEATINSFKSDLSSLPTQKSTHPTPSPAPTLFALPDYATARSRRRVQVG